MKITVWTNVFRVHPSGLYVLFFTEMWERFSYYGMRALLVLYLVNALDYQRQKALSVYAAYTGLVYLTPIAGGYLADRYLGQQRAILAGGIIMAMGHFAMAVPQLLYPALGLLIIGNGLFKPNISTLVGGLYAPQDGRRDAGFTIFYMGINLGAFIAPLVTGTLGEKLGWHFGFAAAGVGMLLGLTIFMRGRRQLGGAGLVPGDAPVPAGNRSASARANDSLRRGELRRVCAIFIMAVFVVFFWMGFEQAGGTMNLFADKQTERVVLGWEIPASYFQAVNPLMIIVLAPVFSALWTRLDQSRLALSAPAKQGIGMIILGLGFVVLAFAQDRAGMAGKVSSLWLIAVYVLHTMGELCLSPIGLSMVTRLAPARLASTLMGLWFTAIALANYLAGTLEGAVAGLNVPLYWFLVCSSIGAGASLLALTPFIRRLMQDSSK